MDYLVNLGQQLVKVSLFLVAEVHQPQQLQFLLVPLGTHQPQDRVSLVVILDLQQDLGFFLHQILRQILQHWV